MNASKSPVLFGMAMVSMGASALGQITEAESGVLKGADIAEHASASGGARVRNLDAAGDSIVLTTIPGGDFLRIRYSLGLKTHKVGSLLVAGAPPKRLVFQPTGGWQYYADLFVPGQTPARVSLALTAEDVRANRNKSSAAIDCVEVVNGTPPVIADEPEIRKRVMGSLLATDASAAMVRGRICATTVTPGRVT